MLLKSECHMTAFSLTLSITLLTIKTRLTGWYSGRLDKPCFFSQDIHGQYPTLIDWCQHCICRGTIGVQPLLILEHGSSILMDTPQLFENMTLWFAPEIFKYQSHSLNYLKILLQLYSGTKQIKILLLLNSGYAGFPVRCFYLDSSSRPQ